MSNGEPRFEQRETSPHVRLPRLDIMDRGSQRERSTSSPAIRRDEQGGLAPYTPWSPGRDSKLPLPNLSRSQSSTAPGPSSHERGQSNAGPSLPRLPQLSRPSSMMAGSLPPLASLRRGESPTYAPLESSRLASSSRLHGVPSHRQPYSQNTHGYPEASVEHYRMTPYGVPPRRASIPTATGLAVSTVSPPLPEAVQATKKQAKAHVSSACLNCKRAHLACDSERPCRRCAKLGKTATCVDVQHKKRGRPRLKDRETDEASPLEVAYASASPWTTTSNSPSEICYGTPALPGSLVPESGSAPYSYHPRTLSDESLQNLANAHERSHEAAHISPRKLGSAATLICGVDMVTVQASQESQAIFGLLPSQICQRSVLDFVHPNDVNLFEDAWSRLVRPVGLKACSFPSQGLEIMHRSTCRLLSPARGTIFVEETVRMFLAGDFWGTCSLRFHLGGAFGLDLYRPETADRAFVVCSIVPTEGGSSMSHPQHYELVSTAFDPLGWPGAGFKTPSERPRAPALPPLSTDASPPHRTLPAMNGQANEREVGLSEQRWRPSASPRSVGDNREQEDDADIRPSKALRLLSGHPSPSASTPASMAASVDTTVSKTGTSVSPVDSMNPKSPLASDGAAVPSDSKVTATSDRATRHPFSTWPSTEFITSQGARPMRQPAFSSARFATASKLSSQRGEVKTSSQSPTSPARRRVRPTEYLGGESCSALAT